jgi:hypothetical protein
MNPMYPVAPPPYGMPPSPYGATSAYGTSATEYEFDVEQDRTIGGLASSMKFVAVMWMIGGGLFAVAGVIGMVALSPIAIGLLVPGAIYFIKGIYTSGASNAFRQVTTSSGDDVMHLTTAFSELGRLYRMMRWLYIIGIVVVVLLFCAGLAMGLGALSSVPASN